MLKPKNMLYLINKLTHELQEAESQKRSLEFELNDANLELTHLRSRLADKTQPEPGPEEQRGTLPLIKPIAGRTGWVWDETKELAGKKFEGNIYKKGDVKRLNKSLLEGGDGEE